ncbi:MAG: cytochrome C [Novosphingobium meiothermophilum]|uniref:SorB family sulfite dehydrogenase c-type cytochrome subunit n=1 Tax=Novosphingobium TaxID=165696 RepID=UPI001F47CEB6|nr:MULTISPECIES: cytochrome C [Novosphingobium]
MRVLLACVGLALLSAASAASGQKPFTIELPDEVVPAALADEEAEPVVAACSTCHSLDYITTQPRGKGAQFWRDTVAKMINVYQAPVEPDEAGKVAELLGRRFG